MRKHIIFMSALLLAGVVSGEAMAVCDSSSPYTTAVNTTGALSTLFSGATICAVKNGGGDEWHEYHNSNTNLEKIGSGQTPALDPVDPNVVIGSWTTVDTPARISYTYTGDATYNWVVYSDGGNNVEFCTAAGGTRIATGTLTPSTKVLTAC